MLEDYQWHFDYTRLVRDTGFIFQIYRPKSSITKNIEHIDIQKVLLHQDIELIDKNISTVLEFSLDNEQTSVLDPNFVKIFYISQLSVQYLLFCKKYLDTTVAHLKKEITAAKEQINSLNCYIEQLQRDAVSAKNEIKELQTTLTCQVASTQNLPVFQCNQCPKAFSTEEYLLAHIQRRHENFTNGPSFQVETDKLQLEIKALKERLNNTEKYIHNDDDKSRNKILDSVIVKNHTENPALTDLQHKFEILKIHVDNELRILQTQKFDQEKYEQWFETFLNKLESYNNQKRSKFLGGGDTASVTEMNTCITSQKKERGVAIISPTPMEKVIQHDSTTQTDYIEPSNSICKKCESNSSPQHLSGYYSDKELQPRFEKLEEIIHERVTGSIEKLENQMQSFCNKMNELEKKNLTVKHDSKASPSLDTLKKDHVEVVPNRSEDVSVVTFQSNTADLEVNVKLDHNFSSHDAKDQEITLTSSPEHIKNKNETEFKVVPKPRKKWNTNSSMTGGELHLSPNIANSSNNSSLNGDMDRPINAEEDSTVKNDLNNISTESHVSSEIVINDKTKENIPLKTKSPVPTIPKRPSTSIKREVLRRDMHADIEKQVQNLLNHRLIELGVSPDWLSIPNQSYHRALDIVVHQSNIIKKKYPNCKKIHQEILRKVDNQMGLKKINEHMDRDGALKSVGRTITQIHGTYDSHNSLKKNEKTSQKHNKKMYESVSDSDSDDTLINRRRMVWGKENVLDQTQKKYFNVIQEFSKKKKQNVSPEISVLPKEVKDTEDDQKIEQANKSALRNYPSVASLHKKKVLFNLQSSEETPENKEVQLKQNCGGSTSSIGSSVFDGSKTNIAGYFDKNKNVWDVSDEDFSEIVK